MNNGWIKLHRSVQNCYLWDEKPYDKARAWIDLLLLANHEDRKVNFNGSPILVSRGQHLTSVRKLADRWGWSYDKVLRYLNVLTDEEMIQKDSNKSRTLITIVNYEVYQSDRTPISEQTEHPQVNETNADRTQASEQTEHSPNADRTPTSDKQELKNYKNEKNEKKVKNEKNYTAEIAEVVDYLNMICGTHYKATSEKTKTHIRARLNEDFTVEDFKTVIDKKAREWINDPKMSKFLRPETLFGTKFEQYLNQIDAPEKTFRRGNGGGRDLMQELMDC